MKPTSAAPPSRPKVDSLAPNGGRLRDAIKRFKYGGETEWAPVFGRLLIRHLHAHYTPGDIDLIVANPTHPTRPIRHTELVLQAAAVADIAGRWPIDNAASPTLVKARSTPRSHGADRSARSHVAAAVSRTLIVTDPGRITGRRILVYDDVCATGSQLDAIAVALTAHGAAAVTGIVLAAVFSPHHDLQARAERRLTAMAAQHHAPQVTGPSA